MYKRQVYVFSHDGILTSIEEGSGIYNEDVTYFIDNKDCLLYTSRCV